MNLRLRATGTALVKQYYLYTEVDRRPGDGKIKAPTVDFWIKETPIPLATAATRSSMDKDY